MAEKAKLGSLMLKEVLLSTGVALLGQACTSPRDNEGPTVIMPELAPVVAGVAVFNELTDIELNLEFVINSRCTRVTPLDHYRFVLARQDPGHSEVILEQYVSARALKIRHPQLVKGTYEVRVIHQDHPDRQTKRKFAIATKNPLIVLDVPCLDEI